MTKKTNSLLFRFGLSTLWKNKCIGNKSIRNILQLENIIYIELKKKQLKVLKAIYKPHWISIFVYNDYKLDEKLKNQVLLYYKKVSNLQNVVEKFALNEKTVLWILNNGIEGQVSLTTRFKSFTLMMFFFKKYFLC